jgi:hypothetical protein
VLALYLFDLFVLGTAPELCPVELAPNTSTARLGTMITPELCPVELAQGKVQILKNAVVALCIAVAHGRFGRTLGQPDVGQKRGRLVYAHGYLAQ